MIYLEIHSISSSFFHVAIELTKLADSDLPVRFIM